MKELGVIHLIIDDGVLAKFDHAVFQVLKIMLGYYGVNLSHEFSMRSVEVIQLLTDRFADPTANGIAIYAVGPVSGLYRFGYLRREVAR